MSGKNEITMDTNVKTRELAIVLGLSTRRIQQLAQDGLFEARTRGQYNLADCVKKYMDNFAKKTESIKDEILEAELSIKESKAVVSELEAKELQGKMHRSEDVADMTEDLIYTIRGMLVSLPGRLAVDVVAASDANEAANIIKKEVYHIMDELSEYEYDHKEYEKKVRERRSWHIEGGEDEGG